MSKVVFSHWPPETFFEGKKWENEERITRKKEEEVKGGNEEKITKINRKLRNLKNYLIIENGFAKCFHWGKGFCLPPLRQQDEAEEKQQNKNKMRRTKNNYEENEK